LLSFPLFNMKQADVTNLMYHVFHNVFGETVDNQDDHIPVQEGLSISHIYPNPFRGYLSLDITGVKAGEPLQISVYNLRGQKVKTLYRDNAKSREISLSWDGRDENGNPAPNAVYFIRTVQGAATSISKALKLD